ncbi:unnamed protein product (macronuclear) [Paramecium tetraurelia]|uniref:Transmembrane protein n=1 Tax=Paramecium tetraurelia TaxID=5888 RepID=A0D3Z6_PARTE|nr:uncharacterized protein GSPATT00013228001 [Paramecium tetraurelia]CAK77763.1 unnamed protein product [Paramecium tetraurelia]|eukprot:XP_001445160.1 hypothetical protein (macronuclear) [Paramecium tetraurelia strain d4-2]
MIGLHSAALGTISTAVGLWRYSKYLIEIITLGLFWELCLDLYLCKQYQLFQKQWKNIIYMILNNLSIMRASINYGIKIIEQINRIYVIIKSELQKTIKQYLNEYWHQQGLSDQEQEMLIPELKQELMYQSQRQFFVNYFFSMHVSKPFLKDL